MIHDIIENLKEFNIIPSLKEIEKVMQKVKNNEELDIYDIITIRKIKILNLLKKGNLPKI